MEQINHDARLRPRGRPRAYDPDVALAQASQAFWRGGYAGTSLDEIAAATGMNRPSLRAAFGDKHALYLAALRAYWARKFETLGPALEGGTLAQALMRVYESSLSVYYSGDDAVLGCFVLGTAITEAAQDAEIRAVVAAGFQRLDTEFAARIRLAQAAGELGPEADPEALAVLACGLMQTLALRARAGADREALRQMARVAVAAICP